MRLESLNRGGRTVGLSATLAAALFAAGSAFGQAAAPAAKPAPAPAKSPAKSPATPKETPGTEQLEQGKAPAPAQPSVKELLSSTQEGAGAAAADRAQAPIDGPPAIEFIPAVADLGEMVAGTPKSVTIQIKNITDQPIRITKAIPGCGCTTPVWPKDPIAPGATADCQISMNPGDKGGIHLNKKVTFNIEGHSPVVLTVQGDVVTFVSMSPEMLEQPADMSGAPATDLKLEATDGTAFKITEVSPPVVKDLPTDAATKHVLKVDWALWEETGRQKRVVVKTDHPKAAQLTALVRRSMVGADKDAPTPPTGPRPMAGPGTTELITAVRANDLSKVKALIQGGANVNEQDRAGSRTALHWAAKGGNLEALSTLISAKADPNLKDRQGRTPLWGAVENTPEVVKFLLDNGGDLNARDTVNATPLLWAAGFGRPETVRLLIERKADVKAVDDNGWTALIWAAGIGQPQTVDILVKAGADLNAADRQTGDTPLLRAARTGKPESLKVLLDAGANIGARNNLQQTALHCAAQSGSAEKVALLLAAKADPAAVDNRNFTALDYAMNRTTGDKSKLIEILKPVSPAPSAAGSTAPAAK